MAITFILLCNTKFPDYREHANAVQKYVQKLTINVVSTWTEWTKPRGRSALKSCVCVNIREACLVDPRQFQSDESTASE